MLISLYVFYLLFSKRVPAWVSDAVADELEPTYEPDTLLESSLQANVPHYDAIKTLIQGNDPADPQFQAWLRNHITTALIP